MLSRWHWLLPALLSLLTGCATTGYPPLPPSLRQDQCRALLDDYQQAVNRGGLFDAEGWPLPQHPYLRVDRFLASFDLQQLRPQARREWLQRSAVLGATARRQELQRLPQSWDMTRRGDLQQCVQQRLQILSAQAAAPDFAERIGSVDIPPDYRQWQQVLGIYPLLRPLVASRVAKLNTQLLAASQSYDWQLPAWPLRPTEHGRLSATDVKELLERARARSQLDIPWFTPQEQARLFAQFAPQWEIETAGDGQLHDYDRPVRPWRAADGLHSAAADQVYTQLSYTRFGGWVLPQFSYVLWFAERPSQGAGDIYAGRLDGLIWRVTLGPDGLPLVYDSIHPCGCYHLWVIPGHGLTLRMPALLEEPLILPFSAKGDGPLRLRVQSGSHYLLAVRELTADAAASGAGGSSYRMVPYAQLAASTSVTTSLFAPSGLVPGTERPERMLLWPTGVPSAGAMRQWGHHAISFVGEQHFDDADLLQQVFIEALPWRSPAAESTGSRPD